jgi:hypothetical protein
MNNPQWRTGEYDTSFIPRYNILDQVVKYVQETKNQSSGPKTAAALAAVQAVIMASTGGQQKKHD